MIWWFGRDSRPRDASSTEIASAGSSKARSLARDRQVVSHPDRSGSGSGSLSAHSVYGHALMPAVWASDEARRVVVALEHEHVALALDIHASLCPHR
jgi:hypothetical protein